MIRYRTGRDARTGKVLRGAAHLEQSIRIILMTQIGEMVMLLDFGVDLVRRIGRNIHPELLLKLYSEIILAVHRWEPECRINQIQVVMLERTGSVGLAISGTYYPEGRLGNYDISQSIQLSFPVTSSEVAV